MATKLGVVFFLSNLIKEDEALLHTCHLLLVPKALRQKDLEFADGTPLANAKHECYYNLNTAYDRENLFLTLSQASTSAPFPANNSQVSLWPSSAARCNGVYKPCVREREKLHRVCPFKIYFILLPFTKLAQTFPYL